MADERKCSKCGEEPATNGHAWGKLCKAKYQREWRDLEAEMLGARNWQAGANAIRRQLAQAFDRTPGAMFEASAIARFITGFPPPEFVPKSTEAERVQDVG